jgi:hypothetical protein
MLPPEAFSPAPYLSAFWLAHTTWMGLGLFGLRSHTFPGHKDHSSQVSRHMALAPNPLCGAGRGVLSGFVAMFHRNDHISLFMPLLDIVVRLDDMLQWINPVYDRFYLTRLNQLLDKY